MRDNPNECEQEIIDNMGKGIFTPNFENGYRKVFIKQIPLYSLKYKGID